jgi:choline dehydrogenase-like flavoprotein
MNSLLGLKTVDYNGAQQVGTAIIQNTIKDGIRSSTANAYLESDPHPSNSKISVNSYVTKVLIRHKKAKGVEFIKNNQTYRVCAKKEVIVCAGKTIISLFLFNIL